MDPIKERVVNPEDEVFWKRLREAFDRVAANHSQSVAVEVAHRRADLEASSGIIIIMVTEIEPEPEPLIIPPGSMTLDPRDLEAIERHVEEYGSNA